LLELFFYFSAIVILRCVLMRDLLEVTLCDNSIILLT
jgi:hypothetical protein